jgi:hypothetical protein
MDGKVLTTLFNKRLLKNKETFTNPLNKIFDDLLDEI